MTFGQKKFTASAPDKGSFPLDHDGECKREMLLYMACLRKGQNENGQCRVEAKTYLDCRMKNGLMQREEWNKLGLKD